MWYRKLLWLALIVAGGVMLDVMYLYTARTAGGWGFKVKLTPDLGD